MGFPGGSVIKNPSAGDAGNTGSILGQEDPLDKGMTTHSNFLSGKSHGDGGLQSIGWQRVGHDWMCTTYHFVNFYLKKYEFKIFTLIYIYIYLQKYIFIEVSHPSE